jgi:hypothetical protein
MKNRRRKYGEDSKTNQNQQHHNKWHEEDKIHNAEQNRRDDEKSTRDEYEKYEHA